MHVLQPRETASLGFEFTFLKLGRDMNRSITVTFALLVGAFAALVGCASMPGPSAKDDAATLLNYPYVAVSATYAQASLSYPWANIAADSVTTEDVAASDLELYYPWTAFSAYSDEPTNDYVSDVSLYYPWTAFSTYSDEPTNDLVVADSKQFWYQGAF